MKYSLYSNKEKDDEYVFNLYLENQIDNRIDHYSFVNKIAEISNEPNITKIFGYSDLEVNDDYYLYPLDLDGVSVGNYYIVEEHPKFLKLKFEDGLLIGEWIIRKVDYDGYNVLFWKPPVEGYACPARSLSYESGKREPVIVEQKFNAGFPNLNGIHDFNGIAISTGIMTGGDLNTTLFDDNAIDRIYDYMNKNKKKLIVDFSHDFVDTGSISDVKLITNSDKKYIQIFGHSNKDITSNAGLSLAMKSTLEFDDDLNVYRWIDGEVIGVSILPDQRPACKICTVSH